MEELPIITSSLYEDSLKNVFRYGQETFGTETAINFFNHTTSIVLSLKTGYLTFPECRYLSTKTHIYRNIIIGSYLIIYRVTKSRIEVLDIISSRKSLTKIKATRKIRI